MIISVAPLLRQPIGTQVSYEIAEDPVDPRGDNAALQEAGFESVDARLTATHTNPGALLEGNAVGRTRQQCSRCLLAIDVTVEASFAEQYYATIGVVSGEAIDIAPPDAKTIGSDFHIDLTPLVAEELVLASPLAPLCRPDCRGLCLECGEDQNLRPHGHEDGTDERWAALRRLQGGAATEDDGPGA